VVPFALGEKLFGAANEPKTFLKLDAHNHNDPLPTEYHVRLREFLYGLK
jgi:hypothetical protein